MNAVHHIGNDKSIVVCGCHVGGLKAIEGLLAAGINITHFVCLTPEQAERYKVSGYYDYRPLAEKYQIPVYIPSKYELDGAEDESFFLKNKFALLIQGGWQRLFPASVLNSLSIGALGLHGSSDLLPKGRGRSPMNWSLIEGRRRFLMHLFIIKPGVDDGDVVAIRDFDITDFDDIETLYYKYSIVYRELLLNNIGLILNGSVKVVPQVGEPSYYPKRTAADGLIHWETMDVWDIYNFVRAQTRPYPGAHGLISGGYYRIWRCRVFDTRLVYPTSQYGECVEMFGNKIIVNCRGGLLLVDEFEPIKEGH